MKTRERSMAAGCLPILVRKASAAPSSAAGAKARSFAKRLFFEFGCHEFSDPWDFAGGMKWLE